MKIKFKKTQRKIMELKQLSELTRITKIKNLLIYKLVIKLQVQQHQGRLVVKIVFKNN